MQRDDRDSRSLHVDLCNRDWLRDAYGARLNMSRLSCRPAAGGPSKCEAGAREQVQLLLALLRMTDRRSIKVNECLCIDALCYIRCPCGVRRPAVPRAHPSDWPWVRRSRRLTSRPGPLQLAAHARAADHGRIHAWGERGPLVLERARARARRARPRPRAPPPPSTRGIRIRNLAIGRKAQRRCGAWPRAGRRSAQVGQGCSRCKAPVPPVTLHPQGRARGNAPVVNTTAHAARDGYILCTWVSYSARDTPVPRWRARDWVEPRTCPDTWVHIGSAALAQHLFAIVGHAQGCSGGLSQRHALNRLPSQPRVLGVTKQVLQTHPQKKLYDTFVTVTRQPRALSLGAGSLRVRFRGAAAPECQQTAC